MKSFLGVIVAVAACGKVEDPHHLADAPPGPDDVRVDAPADAMADAAPPRCDPAKAFGTPTPVTELNTGATEQFAELSADELTVVFASNRTGGAGDLDLYIATRATRTAAWGAPALLAGVNTAGRERRGIITANGLALYAEVKPNASTPTQIARATRATTSSSFGALGVISGINNGGNNDTPFITGDETSLYFGSDRTTAGDFNLYVASGTAGSFSLPALVGGTNLVTNSAEDAPTVAPDQLTMYFASDRAGNSGNDVWMATRTNLTTAFGTPVNVSALNTTAPEVPSWVSADSCVIYFYRDIGLAASNNDIFMATKPL